jgi:hypothetical protein
MGGHVDLEQGPCERVGTGRWIPLVSKYSVKGQNRLRRRQLMQKEAQHQVRVRRQCELVAFHGPTESDEAPQYGTMLVDVEHANWHL